MILKTTRAVQERVRTLGVRKRELEKRKAMLLKNQEKNISSITQLNQDLKHVNVELVELAKKKFAPLVTEHALVRYLERVKHIDIEVIRKNILPEATIQQILTLGDGRYPVGEYIIVVVNNTVVTVLTHEDQPS